jgi:Flp pilus assembly protein TadD
VKTISQIIAGAQAILAVSYDLTGCFEEYLSDEYKTFLHMLRVIEEQMPTLIRAYAGTGRIPYQYTPFIRSFLAKRYFGIEKTSQLIQRLKGEPNLRLLCGFTDVPGKATFSRALAVLSGQGILEQTLEGLVSMAHKDLVVYHVKGDSNPRPIDHEGAQRYTSAFIRGLLIFHGIHVSITEKEEGMRKYMFAAAVVLGCLLLSGCAGGPKPVSDAPARPGTAYDNADDVRLKAGDAEAYNKRGNAYRNNGDYDKAIEEFNQALRLNPNYAEAYSNRGAAWGATGDYDKAIEDFSEAIRLNPDYANAYYNRGITWGTKGDYDKAIEDYSQALRLNPGDAGVYYNRGNAWGSKEDYDKAIADFTEAIRLNPGLAEAYYSRGLIYAIKEDYDRALADWEKALQLNPDDDLRQGLEALGQMGY